MNNKGTYELFTSFMFIIVIIVAVLFMLFLGANSTAVGVNNSKELADFSQANFAKEKIQSCWGELSVAKINSVQGVDLCKGYQSSGVKGYNFEIRNFFSCKSSDLSGVSFGDYSKCRKKFPYLVAIDDNKGQSCLGRLTLCMGG